MIENISNTKKKKEANQTIIICISFEGLGFMCKIHTFCWVQFTKFEKLEICLKRFYTKLLAVVLHTST